MNIILALLLTANATELTVVNKTGDLMRIASLQDKCKGIIVTEKDPIYLKANEEYTFKNLTPVVHTYMVCGSGFCSNSAVGFQDDGKYTLKVIIQDGYINGKEIPDVWPGNLECK
jgi:hypothetical protein